MAYKGADSITRCGYETIKSHNVKFLQGVSKELMLSSEHSWRGCGVAVTKTQHVLTSGDWEFKFLSFYDNVIIECLCTI